MKLLQNGTEVDVTRMAVVKSEERTNEYLLDNGTILRAKLIVMGIYRLEGQQDAQGQPVYQIQSQMILHAEVS